jgi:glyoxylase-like metal-dependent hydrolase (beta-lactamase superfamily II)/ferredoxin
MATLALRLPTNVAGDFFVDSTCIDCDACRQIAPAVFRQTEGQAAVFHQPAGGAELLAAQKALVSCPTASIGSILKHPMEAALAAYPEPVDENVFRCGFTSDKSFGAFSYLIVREQGNVLIDSPRFSGPIVKNIAARGGVSLMLLTHADDVADHRQYSARFNCQRVLHADDVGPDTADVEFKPEGTEPVAVDRDILMIPVPGHTRGSAVYLYRSEFLFTGDHLAWDEVNDRLYAFRGACWYSWKEQIASMERLTKYRFRWVLPGHGRPVELHPAEMQAELLRCVEWMKSRSRGSR